MAGRKPGFRHSEAVRQQIQTKQLVNRLDKFSRGEIELSQAQVNAIKVLLDKTLPSLQSVDSTVDARVSTKFERKVYATETVAVSPENQGQLDDETDGLTEQ